MQKTAGFTVPPGPSIIELMWLRMDSAYRQLKSDPSEKNRGRCNGIADCLALMTNPYKPNPKAIADEAIARYKAAHRE